jgi:hypothetical protein
LLAVVLLLSLRGWGTFQVGVNQDDAYYVVLARSIAHGPRYGLISAPGPPPPVKYPFGFPLLLAPVIWMFPRELLAATVVSLAATLANVSLLFWGWPRLSPTTSRWWGLGVAALYGLWPLAIKQTRMAMSEPAFTTCVLAALVVTESSLRRTRAIRWTSVGLGVLLMLAVFTRTLGVALVAAVVCRIVQAGGPQRSARLAGVVIGSVGSLALVLGLTAVDLRQMLPGEHLQELRNTRPATSGAYVRLAPSLVRPLRVAVGYGLEDVRDLLLPVGGGERERALAARLGLRSLPEAIGAVIFGLLAAGAWRAVRLHALSPSVFLFELFYCGAISLWPWHMPRYLYPIQPILALQFLLGLAWFGDAATRGRSALATPARRLARLGLVGVWAAVVAVAVWKSWAVEDSRRFVRDLSVGASWLAANSPSAAVVMTHYPPSVYLYAERRTIDVPPVQSAAELERVLDEQRVDYLMIGPELEWHTDGGRAYDEHTQRVLLPALAELVSSGRLTIVYESPARDMVRVYRVESSRHREAAAAEVGRRRG